MPSKSTMQSPSPSPPLTRDNSGSNNATYHPSRTPSPPRTADSNSTTTPGGTSTGGGLATDKPRLSSPQKKANHIASEQKRRQAIRDGFDRLTEIIPGLEGQGRSESVVLKRTVEFMREQIAEREALRRECARVDGQEVNGGASANGNETGRK